MIENSHIIQQESKSMTRGQVIAFVLLGLFLISVLPLFPSALEPIHQNDSSTVDGITEKQILALEGLPSSVKVSGRTGNSTFPGGLSVNASDAYYDGIDIDSSDHAYITGYFEDTATFGNTSLFSNGDEDVFIAKLSSNGSWLWAVNAGGSNVDNGYAVAVSGSSVFVTGSFNGSSTFGNTSLTSSSVNDSDIFVAKLSSDGSWIWAVSAGGSGSDKGLDIIAPEGSSAVYVVGVFESTATFVSHSLGTNLNVTSRGGTDIFVSEILDYGPVGDWFAVRDAGSPGEDFVWELGGYSSENLYVTGWFEDTATFSGTSLTSRGGNDVFIASWETQYPRSWSWAVSAGGPGDDRAWGIAIDSSGNAYVTGHFTGQATFGNTSLSSWGDDIFVAKLSSNGSWLWAVDAGGAATERGYGIAFDSSGNVYINGFFGGTATFGSTSLTSDGQSDAFIAKLTSNGSWQWAVKAGGPENEWTLGIAIDSSNNAIVTGPFITIHQDQDMDGINNTNDKCHDGAINWTSDISTDHDKDGCRDADEDDDDDDDGIIDLNDSCPKGVLDWTSSSSIDHDGDGCYDIPEDDDDDNDGVLDGEDYCKTGELTWVSTSMTDYDSDGCQDSSEDLDDDNDGVDDNSDACLNGSLDWISDKNLDYDSDGCRDSDEDLDDDNDGVLDNLDSCRIGALNWSSGSVTDIDGDGCRDLDEDDEDKNQESDNQISSSEGISFVDRLIEGDLDAIGIILALFLPIIGLGISVMLKKRKIGLVNSITLKVNSADSTEALIQIGLEIDEIMANDKISQVQYQSLKNKIESKKIEFSPLITGDIVSSNSVESNYNSEIGEQSVTMQDSVIGGDSLVGSTKIEKQVYNDPEAIARAAVEAFRMGAESKNPLSDKSATHFKDDNGNE